MNDKKIVLPIIVISQLFCTSLWFAGNAVIDDLTSSLHLQESALGYLISTVQFGFIIGTLLFAIFSIADRFSPSKVFFVCAFLGALANLSITWEGNSFSSILLLRFLIGFFLAGIYPVGMKIAADYYEKGLGKSLGFLVGALVVGTALPHLLKDIKGDYSWEIVLFSTSSLALLGGLLVVILIPDGPYRAPNKKLNILSTFNIFKAKPFRLSAFGYFGHMWELYTFWAFVPVILQYYTEIHPETFFKTSLLSFIIIGVGGFSCTIGGFLAQKMGAKKMAFISLFLSCMCCLISPVIFLIESQFLFVTFLIFWGMVVIADSPLLSTLVAKNAPSTLKGTALTIVNSIGFAITIVSIQITNLLREEVDAPVILIVLALGPILGLISLKNKKSLSTKVDRP
ncbi:MFS transporter [Seonamhaeicola sediminis]|uniref:MFS transporter n=1 Tax=Seonamhaeicola sediminis TaxID=2528206 RepID=A0A562YD38_9FLAO|nr:MFS transporter [Seonamhaeicola sediminis]TWO32535.1 MFS transporter [Seonamhaeicola sediminis]